MPDTFLPDDAVMPEGAEVDPADSDESMICLPEMAIAVDGVAPDEGDSVSFTTAGTVEKRQDGKVWVRPDTINGDPVPKMPARREETDDELEAAAMADARSMPSDY